MQLQRTNSERVILKSARVLDNIDDAFRDHVHAAHFLLDMGILLGETRAHLISFAPGGHSVAQVIANTSGVLLDQAAVTALSPAWLGGPIFGAAAFDGTVVIDEELKAACSVSRHDFHRNVERAYETLAELVEQSRGDSPFPDLSLQTAIVVDDGLSSPLVTRVAMAAARNAGARRVVLAMPIGHRHDVQQLTQWADLTYCASIRRPRHQTS